MKTLLVFPPHWTPAMPHLALPALAAYLRAHGVEVILRDLNLETFEYLLQRRAVEAAVARLRAEHGSRGDRRLSRGAGGEGFDQQVRWALAFGPRLAAQIEGAVATMRSAAFLDGPAGRQAFEVIAQTLAVVSLPFYPSAFNLTEFIPPIAVDSSRALLQAARDPGRNMLVEIFRRVILPDIVRERPDIVGISIPTMGQMLAAVTLAYLIKQARLPCHVTVGGPHVTMLREQFPRAPALFDLFDSAVVFDGETPLLRLAETLDAHGDLSQVPNLVWRDGGQVRVNDLRLKPQADTLPDFDGLPLDRYLAPEPVLPLLTAHGCYHGKCAFCNVGYGEPGHFRPQPPEAVVAQMLALRQKYGVRHIFFADEAMTPHSLRKMSALLEAQGSPLHWCGCARFEKALTQELLASMARGGCRMLLFGLETASERMIEHIVKGTQREQMGRVLRESAQAGIWNHTFFFFGFPTETMDDAQDTINFVYAHGDAIHSASPGEFVLERDAPVYRQPGKFGVRRIIRRPDRDLAIYFGYELESGLDEEMARTVVERLLDVLPTKQNGQYYVQDVYRLLYAGHLHDQGRSFPPWLADEVA